MRLRGVALVLILSVAAMFPLLDSGQALAHGMQRPPSAHLPAGGSHPIEHFHRRLGRSSGWGTATSRSWAGYAATGGGFASVTASWIEPPIQASSSGETYAGFWVGLDGHGSSTVEQTGTAAYNQYGSVSYYAWYEMYPNLAISIPMTVSPGDEMTGTVTSGGTGSFTLTLVDDTTHETFTAVQTNGVTAPFSAEVIAEAPSSSSGTIFPLADFGSVSFTNCAFNGRPISTFAYNQIDMVSAGGLTKAATSTLGADGASFSVTSYSAGDSTPPITGASGYDGAWHSSAVHVTLTATDNAGGSDVKSITYRIGSSAPTTVDAAATQVTIAAPTDHSNDGVHTLSFYSTDNDGNQETANVVTVKIDTVGPTTVAKPASGHKGKAIALKYRVTDNLGSRATSVTLTIRNSHKKVVKTLKLGTKKVSAWNAVKWTPKAKGTYRYTVTAKDLAGNKQAKAGSAKITVKSVIRKAGP